MLTTRPPKPLHDWFAYNGKFTATDGQYNLTALRVQYSALAALIFFLSAFHSFFLSFLLSFPGSPKHPEYTPLRK
jgi:hypothetical protein